MPGSDSVYILPGAKDHNLLMAGELLLQTVGSFDSSA